MKDSCDSTVIAVHPLEWLPGGWRGSSGCTGGRGPPPGEGSGGEGAAVLAAKALQPVPGQGTPILDGLSLVWTVE
jgi:hypothetical protein